MKSLLGMDAFYSVSYIFVLVLLEERNTRGWVWDLGMSIFLVVFRDIVKFQKN